MKVDEQLVDDRKHQEAEFHDRRERDRLALTPEEFDRKYANMKYYSVVRRSREFLENWYRAHAPGRRVLDYCCGLGGTSLELARCGALVSGFDISEESVRTARRTLAEAGLRGEFQVMDAERLAYADHSFDVIIVSGVLHHLDVNRAYPELARVLRPGGKILCLEALGYNPIINLYRQRTPQLRTDWEKDHILTMREVELARRYFDRVQVWYYHLFTIAAVPFRNRRWFPQLLNVFERLDRLILRIPAVRLLAWQMVFELSGPREAR